MLDTPQPYNAAWVELNAALKRIEAFEGLGGAIAALEANQRQTGFIEDSLFDVERHVFHHPDDPSRLFRVQFNARRKARFNGAGLTEPPEGTEVAHGGCFLCRENVSWQQQGMELGFEVDVNGWTYNTWMNPFPLMPGQVVIASAVHQAQDWAYGPNGGIDPRRLIGDLAALASRMPGYVGFYNGVGAGASIPGHLHYQFFQRPVGLPDFPLEVRLRDCQPDGDGPAIAIDYPLPVVKWNGAAQNIADAAPGWIDGWARRNAERIYRLTANIIVSATDDGAVTLYFVPRDRAKPRGVGMSGLVGGLEILGELVFSSAEERRLIDSGAIDYFVIENILGSVATPLFIDAP